MRTIAALAAVLAAAVAAAVAAATPAAAKDPDAPVRVQWSSPPPAGPAWDARFSLLQGPGGFVAPATAPRPVVLVTNVRTHATRRIAARVDVPPNTFRADVRLPGPGTWRIAVARFDPRRPGRTAAYRTPVRIAAAPARRGDGTPAWPWALVAAPMAVAVAIAARRRAQAAGTAPSGTTASGSGAAAPRA